MDPAAHAAALRSEVDAMADATRGIDLASPVPSCPGWTVADLLAHTGSVHLMWLTVLRDRPTEVVRRRDLPAPPEGDALTAWFTETATATADLVADLVGSPGLHDVLPTWAGPQPGTFIVRRLAHETAVHRWDAQTAAGTPGPVETSLAVDGVDELLELFAPLIPADRIPVRGTIHLHATDEDLGEDTGEWVVTVADTGIGFEHGHAKGDVALRGTASDLLLWTWGRVPADDRFDVFGDAALLDGFRSAVRF